MQRMRVLLAFGCCAALASTAGASEPVDTSGIQVRSAQVNFTALAKQEAAAGAASREVKGTRPRLRGPMGWPLPPDANVVPEALAVTSRYSAANRASPAPSASFTALLDSGTSIPPDTHGAVGPNHVMTTLNTQVRIQNRSGGNISTVSLEAFWAAAGNPDTFDPKVFYDGFANRWIFICCGNAQAPNSAVLVGVTQNSDPTGTWNLFSVDADSANIVWADYPSVGFNKDWVVVTMNMFTVSASSFVRSNIYVFDKNALYAGTAPFRLFQDTEGFTYVPAITFDNTLATVFLIDNFNGGTGTLRLSSITGPLGTETFNRGIAFPDSTATWGSSGPDAPQLGTQNKIDNGDARMQSTVFRNGNIWCTHSIYLPANSPTRTAVQWWQISPTGAVLQRGRVDDETGKNFFSFPCLTVNKNDDMLLGYSRFSDSQFASANYSFRSAADPANTLQSDTVLKAGETTYFKTFGGASNRWGDYSSTCTDPVDDVAMWTIGEYAASPANTWGTHWGQVAPGGTTSNRPTVTVQATDPAASEGGDTGTIIFSRDGPTTAALTVSFTLAGTATPDDFAAPGSTVTIQPGQSSATLTITPVDDAALEGDETVVVQIASSPDYTPGNPASSSVVIGDNDNLPTVSVTAPDSSASEAGPGVGIFVIARTGSSTAALNVAVTLTGTATNGADYVQIVSPLVIPAGQSSLEVNLTPIDDAEIEQNETVVLTIVSNPAYILGTPTDATVNLGDNDQSIVVITSTIPGTAETSVQPGQFTFSRSRDTTAAITVNYAVSGTGANGVDYQMLPGSITLGVGVTQITLDVVPIDDLLTEGDESAVVQILPGTAYTVGAPSAAAVGIADNDTAPPPNDAFANRILLGAAAPQTVSGLNVGATKEVGEPNHGDNAGGASIWYEWTPATSGTATLNTVGSNFNTLLGVYIGTAVNTLTLVAGNDAASGGNPASRVVFEATAGTPYKIAVDGFAGSGGTAMLNINLQAPAADLLIDNLFHMPIVLNVGDATTFTVTVRNNGTVDAGPFNLNFFMNLGVPPTASTPPDQTQPVAGLIAGATMNFTFPVVAPPNGAYRAWAFVDPLNAVAELDEANNAGPLPAGHTWLVGITPPANDNFVNAISLAGSALSTNGSNVGASKESGEPFFAGNKAGASVWFSWVAQGNGTATISTIGSNYDTTLAVFTGTAVTALTVIAANDDNPTGGTTSIVTYQAIAGTTYFIGVAGHNADAGNYTLNLTAAGTAGPDLIVDSVSIEPASPSAGSVATFNVIIKNQGTVDAPRFNVGFFSNRMLAPVITAAPEQDLDILGLVAGASAQLSFNARVPAQPGAFFAWAFPDRFNGMNEISETNENNNAGPGTSGFSYTVAAAPTTGGNNDMFASALALSGVSPLSATGTNAGATKETGEPSHGGNSGGASIWFAWTAVNSSSVIISTMGSNFDTLLGVYTGTSVSALTQIAGNDDAEGTLTSQVEFAAVAGTTYFIAVDGFQSATGNIAVNVLDTSTGGTQGPDLEIESISLIPANPQPGQTMTFTVRAKNRGTTNATMFNVGFFANRATAPTLTSTPDQNQTVNSLASQSHTDLTFSMTAPANGSYTAWGFADRFNEVTEADETDNAGPAPSGFIYGVGTSAPPSNLVATPDSATVILLTWTDNSTDETDFVVERSVDGIAFTELGTVGAGVTSAQNTGLEPGTTRFYRIRARNAFGDSAPSNVATATTPSALPMTVLKVSGSFKFNFPGKDSVQASGFIGDPSLIRDLTGSSVTVDIGGASASFTLGLKGAFKSTTTQFTFKNGVVKFRLRNGDFVGDFLDEGIDPEADQEGTIDVDVTVEIDGDVYLDTVTAPYKGKAFKSGRFRF